jgi:hypothetical protein
MRCGARFLPVCGLLLAGCLGDSAPPYPLSVNCGAVAPNVELRAVDAATAEPLPFRITVDGVPVFGECMSLVDGGAGGDAPCLGDLSFVLFGPGVIEVTSERHASVRLQLDGGSLGGLCPAPAYSFDLSVPMNAL